MLTASGNDSPYADGLASQSDHLQGPPRKKMRKGTKSCLECRRRKIKCTFEAGRTAVCNECYARGSTCIDQEHGDIQSYVQNPPQDNASYSLRERVTQLEDLVRQVLHKLPDKTDSGNGGNESIRSQVDAQAGTLANISLLLAIMVWCCDYHFGCGCLCGAVSFILCFYTDFL
jgi:Fungal Zn(2)-Cys(6) binuclear cluster domain